MAVIQMAEDKAEAYLDDMEQKVLAHWAETVETSQFMSELEAGTLPMESIRLFYSNWGAFVPVINSLYMTQFYNNLWFFVSNVDLMNAYTEKVLDEFGHPEPPGHIKILISTGEALGLTQDEILINPMLAEARALTDFQRTLVNNGHPYEYWASVLWESSFGYSCNKWFKALTGHYGLSAEEADYFHKHYEADTQDHLGREAHSSVTKHVLSRLLDQGIAERPGYPLEYCALTPVNLYRQMLDAVYAASH
ncbi:MAG: iron-containing redox enzyme family protein [Alphaproteobacteria bacterium]|nr:iron-containing redox enzyme family protein [Alphaproteobacteria bacterium]